MNPFRVALAASTALALSGCANLSTVFRSFELAEGSGDAAKIKSVALDAQQRTILVTAVPDEFGGKQRMVFCAEPSPDSFFALDSSFGGSGSISRGSSKASGEAAQGLALAGSDALSTRNATIQLLRDGLYRACEAYASGALTRLEYSDVTLRYQRMVLALLSIELISNLNRPRRDPTLAALERKSATDEHRAKGGEQADPLLRPAVASAPTRGVPAEPAPGPQPYTDQSIQTISEKAVALVELVLQSDSEAAQCLRYLSQVTYQRTRTFQSRPSAMEDVCANIVSRAAEGKRAAQETALR